MKNIKVSNNVIRRLPRYLRKLDELAARGETRISSAMLGEQLGFTSSQIRQDFSCFGEFGQQGYGYNIISLRAQIADILGMNRKHTAVIVGVGNIGRALTDNFCFSACGIELKCAFDNDPRKAGKKYNGIEIRPQDELEPYLMENNIDIAVLCVPKHAAVQVADVLIKCGISAIWNFTNVDVVRPYSNVIVENMHFSDSLLALNYYMSEKN